MKLPTLYTADEIHGFMFEDYYRNDPRWIDAKQPQSVHVVMVPWCQCCDARVELDHICECEQLGRELVD